MGDPVFWQFYHRTAEDCPAFMSQGATSRDGHASGIFCAEDENPGDGLDGDVSHDSNRFDFLPDDAEEDDNEDDADDADNEKADEDGDDADDDDNANEDGNDDDDDYNDELKKLGKNKRILEQNRKMRTRKT
jgi:hypothetical protein